MESHIVAAEMTIMKIMQMTCLLLLYCFERIIGTGSVNVYSPGIEAGIAPVCSGDKLELTCATTGRVLDWRITAENRILARHPVDSVSQVFPTRVVTISPARVMFTFSRISLPNSQPLKSKLLISPANVSINGVMINCSNRETGTNSSLTRVNVIETDLNTLIDIVQAAHIVNFTILLARPEGSHVNLSVSLHLNGINPEYLYHINVVPEPCCIVVNNATQMMELKVLYDIHYNVSIVVCEQSSIPLIGLYYSKCGTSPTIIDYDGHLQEGTSIASIVDCPETSQLPTNTNTKDIKPSGSTDAIIGTTLGIVVFGVSVLCTVAGVIWAFLRVKRKSVKDSNGRKLENEIISGHFTMNTSTPPHDDQSNSKIATKGLMYAEVGQLSHQYQQNKQLTFLDLDDTHIEYAQLNHKVHVDINPGTQGAQPFIKSKPVDDVNLDNLLIQLRPQVTPKWYQFGEAAGIQRDVLNNFAKQCSPTDCIMEMLDFWLRNCKALPTWNDVAKILKEINLTQLSHDIEGVYTTGKLPVDVDMDWIPETHQLGSELSEPPPPPIPPKMMMVEDWSSENFVDREQKHLKPTELESSVPTLPPKPNNRCEISTNVPARPPKPKSN